MKLDTGTIVVLVAALGFYLRLILVNRAHATQKSDAKKRGKRGKNDQMAQYWILSPYKRDWIIAGLGFIAMVVGVLIKTSVIQDPSWDAFWWLPLSVGILAFSFGFR